MDNRVAIRIIKYGSTCNGDLMEIPKMVSMRDHCPPVLNFDPWVSTARRHCAHIGYINVQVLSKFCELGVGGHIQM